MACILTSKDGVISIKRWCAPGSHSWPLLPSQNLTAFVAEANMLRANNCQKGISTDDAVKYLKAANFNATKAVDIYKNYQVTKQSTRFIFGMKT